MLLHRLSIRPRFRTALVRALALLFIVCASGRLVRAAEPAPAGRYVQTGWTKKDGLRGSQIWTMAQDRTGYIWLGTNEGLVRFDGVRFMRWAELALPALPSSSVRTLLVAHDGALWTGFGGLGGVARFENGAVRAYTVDDGLPHGLITSLVEDGDGVIWAASVDGLFRLRGDRWEALLTERSTPFPTVDALFVDSRQQVWVGTSEGVFRGASREGRFSLVAPLRDVRSIAEDATGVIWGTGVGTTLARIGGGKEGQWRRPVEASLSGSRLLQDREGGLWIATLGDGLLRLAADDPRRAEVYKGESALTSDVVRCLIQDREGNIWAGTQNGLNRLSRAIVTSVPERGDSMSRLVHAVAADDHGGIWVATGNGLYQFKGEVRRRFGREDGLPSASVSALHTDQRGRVWVATSSGLGFIENDRLHAVAVHPDVQLSRIFGISTDQHGDVWICDLDRGVHRLRDGRPVAIGGEMPGDPRSCFTIYTDRSGRIWTGFLDGTLRVHEDGRVRSFSQKDGLIGGMISSLYEDAAHRLWIGSSNGLTQYHDGRFTAIGWSSGLPGNIVSALTDDGAGYLWLAVSSGIVRMAAVEFDALVRDPHHRLRYTLYDAADGLRGDPIGLGSPTMAAAPGGVLWFVTSDGLARIDSRRAEKTRLSPLVAIEGVIADDRPVAIGSEVRLAPHTGRLQIDFASLSFTAPQEITFHYRLEGYDKDWVDAGRSRQAVYTNLPPGSYRFLVQGTNGFSHSENPAALAIMMAPSFSQTAWFPVTLLALAGLAIAGVWRLRVHQVQAKFAAILVERTRVAREIHDTLLQSLSASALKLDHIAATVEKSPRIAERQLHTLRQQVEFYVREARQSIRDLRSPVLETHDLATALRDAGERTTTGEPIGFEFRLIGRSRRLPARIEENLLRIGQEAMNNAIRHGRPARLKVQLTYAPDAVRLRVSDDGAGFDASTTSYENHWGLTSMQERAQQIGGDFRLTSEPGQGTTIEITVHPTARTPPLVQRRRAS